MSRLVSGHWRAGIRCNTSQQHQLPWNGGTCSRQAAAAQDRNAQARSSRTTNHWPTASPGYRLRGDHGTDSFTETRRRHARSCSVERSVRTALVARHGDSLWLTRAAGGVWPRQQRRPASAPSCRNIYPVHSSCLRVVPSSGEFENRKVPNTPTRKRQVRPCSKPAPSSAGVDAEFSSTPGSSAPFSLIHELRPAQKRSSPQSLPLPQLRTVKRADLRIFLVQTTFNFDTTSNLPSFLTPCPTTPSLNPSSPLLPGPRFSLLANNQRHSIRRVGPALVDFLGICY